MSVVNQTYRYLLQLKAELQGPSKALAQNKIKNISPDQQATLLEVLNSGISSEKNLIALNKQFEELEEFSSVISRSLQIFCDILSTTESPSKFSKICESALVKFRPPLPPILRFEKIPNEIRAIIGNFLSKVDRMLLNLFLEKMQLVAPKVSPEQECRFLINKINYSRIPLRAILPLVKDQYLLDMSCRLTHFDVTGIDGHFVADLCGRVSKIKSLVLRSGDKFPFKNKVEKLTIYDNSWPTDSWGRDCRVREFRRSVETIFEFTQLQSLELDQVCDDDGLDFMISNEKIKTLNIKVLSLKNIDIEKGLDKLSNLSCLTHLQISECPLILNKIPSILYNHPRLKVLDLTNNSLGNNNFNTVSTFLKLFKSCPALEVIHLSKIKVTREGYERSFSK